ncbi:MAG: hypothetical protein K1X88_18340 [Nannocystaceae bacterium]|nr:hypothetical protein [Nannocystaceae bacterium]
MTAPGTPPANPVEVYDALETAIGEGRDDEQQRVDALAKVERAKDDGSAAYAFVRAALLGRVAELRGADAGKLVTEAEAWARRSLERDPEYRERAATQMLGSLYVMAPGRLLEHGDSEDGLAMLEGLVEAKPAEPRYHLRLAQAYLHLGDDDAARPQLCAVLPARAQLRGDERKLLDGLVGDAGGSGALGCAAQ